MRFNAIAKDAYYEKNGCLEFSVFRIFHLVPMPTAEQRHLSLPQGFKEFPKNFRIGNTFRKKLFLKEILSFGVCPKSKFQTGRTGEKKHQGFSRRNTIYGQVQKRD